MARVDYLTEELIIEILSWLPADSLMRFKCLNKSWYSLIENPQFVVKQLHNHVRSSFDNNFCVLLRRWIDSKSNDEKDENILSLLIYNDKIQATSEGNDFPFLMKTVNLPFYKEYRDSVMLGNCDGIVFFHDHLFDRELVAIANPGLQKLRILPKSCIFVPYSLRSHEYDDYAMNAMGLGYDSKANDYKIVRVWTMWKNQVPFRRVEVYTLSMDSWKEIDNVDLEGVSFFHRSSFDRYWNGAYYWYAYGSFDAPENDFEKLKDFIVLFDMTSEVFQYIRMPESCEYITPESCDNEHVLYNQSLMEFNGSLALIHFPLKGEEKSFEIWTMDEFGVNGIWTKILCFGPLFNIERPLVFVKSDHLLMEGKGGQMVSYNFKTKQVKRLPIYGNVFANAECFEVMIYMQSLVSIQGRNKVDN